MTKLCVAHDEIKLQECLALARGESHLDDSDDDKNATSAAPRATWGKEVEFLFSCIALSVGLGNIWRFPFVAYENGGGAFLVPYITVLLLIGRPLYYLEVLIGQFTSRGCAQAFAGMVPAMRGVAYGQIYATAWATSYYACVMALVISYLLHSFSAVLPWTTCRADWGALCSATNGSVAMSPLELSTAAAADAGPRVSSAELFFTRVVLREATSIERGIGRPNWDLVLCLLIAWLVIAVVLIKGIRSSGKFAYFLATFPYAVMLTLLGRALTLPGAWDGIVYFLKPQWQQLLNARVWYAAITQMFFSLAICFGTLVMYASFNNFRKNVHRDVLIITTIDSCTSVLGGCIIFGILGNLAHESNAKDIATVVKSGAGLAFISYPEAIAKFSFLPQLFAVLFFLMLLFLGIGSNIGMVSCLTTALKDRFTHLPHWLLAGGISCVGFLCGLVYTTPGGQFILNLVDFYGCSFIALVLAIAEVVAIAWIYGVKRLCEDIEFMLHIQTGLYWRICWAFVTPCLMIFVLIYTLLSYQPLTYKDVEYPVLAYRFAWTIWALGVVQLPFWALHAIYQQSGATFGEKVRKSLRPVAHFAPADEKLALEYAAHRRLCELRSISKGPKNRWWSRLEDNVFG